MSVTVSIREQLRYGLAMAAVVIWIAGSAAARADDCTTMQAGLDKARQEMLAAEKEMTSYSQLINQTRRERDHWNRRIGELGREEGSLLAELSRPDRDPKDDTSLKTKIDKTRSELWRSKNEMAKLNSLISGAYGQELEGFLEASTARHQRAILSQDSYRRQMDNERCAAKLRPAERKPDPANPGQQAAVPPAGLPPLPSGPGADADTAVSGLPPLPPFISPDTPERLPPPAAEARVPPLPPMTSAAADPLPPLPPIDDFVIPPRPSTLTQPPIVEPPPPVAGLPPLPPPPSIASAPPPGTEIIRAPTIRAPGIGAPPIDIPNISAPRIAIPNVSAPPVVIPNVSAPPIHAPVVRAPPIHAPRIEAPNIRGRRVPIGEIDRRAREVPLTPDRRPSGTRVIHRQPPAVAVYGRPVAPRSTARVIYTQPGRPNLSGLAAQARGIGSIGRIPAPTGRRWGR